GGTEIELPGRGPQPLPLHLVLRGERGELPREHLPVLLVVGQQVRRPRPRAAGHGGPDVHRPLRQVPQTLPGARRRHPFTAPCSPETMRFSIARKNTSAGIIARVVNASTPAVSWA